MYHFIVDLLYFSKELTASGLQSLLKRHLSVEKVALERQDELDQLILLTSVELAVINTFRLATSLQDVTEDVFFNLLVSFNLGDGLPLSFALCLPHFLVTELKLGSFSVLLLLDIPLEPCDKIINVWVCLAEHLLVLQESRNDVIVLEGLAAVLEQVLGVVDVSLFQ